MNNYFKNITNYFKYSLPSKNYPSNIESKDKYIIEDDGVTLTFTKNGVIHREHGPAIIYKTNKEKYPTYVEKKLYRIITIKKYNKDYLPFRMPKNYIGYAYYYLEGIEYKTEKEFNLAKLNKELEIDLPTKSFIHTTKKVKI